MSTPGGPPNQPPPGQPGPQPPSQPPAGQRPSGQPGAGPPNQPAQPPLAHPGSAAPAPPQAATSPAPPAPSTGSSSSSGKKLLPLVLAAVLIGSVLTVGGLYLGGAFSSDDATEIRIEPVATVAADPFTPPVGPDVADLPPPRVPVDAPTAAPAAVPGVVSGGKPGLYGGTGENRCDKNQLVAFLQQNPAKAAVWAGVLGISPADIPTYVNGLAEVVLQTDTAVTNHGFKNGRANRIPAILQAGTRVFVDSLGIPVAKCGCGNPLLDGKPVSNPTYMGRPWPTFNPAGVTTIQPAPQPIGNVQLTNVYTNKTYPVPVTSITPAITTPTGVPVLTPTPVAPPAPVVTPTPNQTTTAPLPGQTTSVPPQEPLLPGTYQVTERLASCRDVTPCNVGATRTFTFTIACSGPTACTIDGRPYTRSGSTLTATRPLTGPDAFDCGGPPVPTSESVSLAVSVSAGSPPTVQTLTGQLVAEAPGSGCGDLEVVYELTYTRI